MIFYVEFTKTLILFSLLRKKSETSKSTECNDCQYWYLLNKGFKFQPNICNGCHELLVISMNLSDIAILNIKSVDYCSISNRISITEFINLMQNHDLTEKKGTL